MTEQVKMLNDFIAENNIDPMALLVASTAWGGWDLAVHTDEQKEMVEYVIIGVKPGVIDALLDKLEELDDED